MKDKLSVYTAANRPAAQPRGLAGADCKRGLGAGYNSQPVSTMSWTALGTAAITGGESSSEKS